jgi:hypothetical protein
MTSTRLPLARPSARDQTLPSLQTRISPLPPPALASGMVSPALGSVSNSTAVGRAADTRMKIPAARLQMMITFHAPPAAKASLSAARRLHPFNREIEKTLACKICSQ